MLPINFAGGRPFDDLRLLFVASQEALDTVGDGVEAELDNAIVDPHILVKRSGMADFQSARTQMQEILGEHDGIDGVVVLGGYQDLAAEIKNVSIPPSRSLRAAGDDPPPGQPPPDDQSNAYVDTDNFIVWNDDFYGDDNRDGMPDLPVSRIPHGVDSNFLAAALSSSGGGVPISLLGVRDAAFIYAHEVYDKILPWSDTATAIDPMIPVPNPGDANHALVAGELTATALYLSMHGGYASNVSTYSASLAGKAYTIVDASTLAGEASSNVPRPPFGDVVLSACCYSGLVTDKSAGEVHNLQLILGHAPVLQGLTPTDSVALSLLNLGAVAVVGFTGTHWVPLDEHAVAIGIPAEDARSYMGRPLHESFWKHHLRLGKRPAQALFDAKAEYFGNTPHIESGDPDLDRFLKAIELKTFWSATCLGLGW